MKNFYNNFLSFSLLLFFKRIYIFLNENFLQFKSSIIWLIKSKEHTSFSLELSNENEEAISLQLGEFANIDSDLINKTILKIKKVDFIKSFKERRSYKTVDLDYIPKFDYRLIAITLLFNTNTTNLIELGFNQGRLPFIINSLNKEYFNKKYKYYGIDYNPRKGGFVNELDSKEIKIIIGKVENELVKLKSSTIESSILVVSTHEKASENFIFKYLIEKNIYPKYIISDNVNLESSYKFYLENTKKYKNQIFIFNDKNNFFKSLYCGLSIRS